MLNDTSKKLGKRLVVEMRRAPKEAEPRYSGIYQDQMRRSRGVSAHYTR